MEVLDIALNSHNQPHFGVFSSDDDVISVFDVETGAVVRHIGGFNGEVFFNYPVYLLNLKCYLLISAYSLLI